jgi:large subunit ribosomal protein L25
MAIVQLKGEVREKRGKGPARTARREGKVPGVIYGRGEPSLSISIDRKELVTVMQGHAGSNVIIDLRLSGLEAQDRKALIRELQRDPITGEITHIDLQHISMTQVISVDVPVHVTGIAIGVKDFGGILEFVTRSITVECLPTDIPDSVTVDISPLGIHDSIHVRDISLPNATITLDPDQVLVTVVAPTVEKAPVAAEEAVAEEAAEPEVIGKKKEEGEETAEADKEKDKKEEKDKKKEKK